LICSLKGKKKSEVRVPAFQSYCTFSVWWAGSLGKKKPEVRVPAFQSYCTFSVWWAGPKETRGARSSVPEIFHIFWFGRYKYVPSPLRNNPFRQVVM
ncbi:hypothetical protein K443DRAFT_116554, partial [Laccaria amethystina LaAM-08-1]